MSPLLGAGGDRKVTLGITGSSRARAPIDPAVWVLDVGSSHPGSAAGAKGGAARPLKGNVRGLDRRETGRSLPDRGVVV